MSLRYFTNLELYILQFLFILLYIFEISLLYFMVYSNIVIHA